MTMLHISDGAKKLLRFDLVTRLKGDVQNIKLNYVTEEVKIPKKVFASLLKRSYSAMRIALEPRPIVYGVEISSRVGYKRNGVVQIRDEKPETPPGLGEYLETRNIQNDCLLNIFSSKDNKKIKRDIDDEDIRYEILNTTPFNFEDDPANLIWIHTHIPLKDDIYALPVSPSFTDFRRGAPFSWIIYIDVYSFAKFVFNHKIKKKDTEQLNHNNIKIMGETFLSMEKTREFAKQYAEERITHLNKEVEKKGIPILIYEKTKYKDDTLWLDVFENYQIQ